MTFTIFLNLKKNIITISYIVIIKITEYRYINKIINLYL